ncbi:MAG: isochorismatase family protein [Thaumarchaeota archaeon]|nr:isochorismatase family protein [Nitrososphaerota archaeon]
MQIVDPQTPGFISSWISSYYEGGSIATEPLGYGLRPAVVVIDLQKSGSGEKLHPMVARAVANTSMLLKEARDRNIPVLYTVNAFRKDLKDMPPTKLKSLSSSMVGTRSVEVMDEVAPHSEDLVLQKQTHSPFVSTHILFHLTRLRADTVLVTGIHTGGCIRATANDAFSYGFHTVIPEECVADRKGMNPHKGNLCDLHIRGADVVTLGEVLEYIDTVSEEDNSK